MLNAQPFFSFDVRSMGMGGSSVASSKLANAAYSNPALLSRPIGDETAQLLLPVIGVNVVDSQGLINDIREFNDAYDALDIPTATSVLARSIGKPLTVQAYAGGAFGFAVDSVSMVFIYNKQFIGDFRTRSSPLIIDATLDGRGLEVTETGIAIPIFSGNNFKFGITPKVVNVNSYDYFELLIDVAAGTTILNQNTGKRMHNSYVNVDLGSAYDFNNGFVFGLVARNLNSKEFTTIFGNKIKLQPLMRAGIAYNSKYFTLAADMDLNENSAIAYGEKSKLVTIGAELNFFDWVAIRLGHQRNTASVSDQSMNSIGLGFTPFGVGLDIALMGNQYAGGASAQLSFTF